MRPSLTLDFSETAQKFILEETKAKQVILRSRHEKTPPARATVTKAFQALLSDAGIKFHTQRIRKEELRHMTSETNGSLSEDLIASEKPLWSIREPAEMQSKMPHPPVPELRDATDCFEAATRIGEGCLYETRGARHADEYRHVRSYDDALRTTKITSHEQEDETEVFESLEPIYTVFDSNYLLQQPMAETTKTEDRAQARSTAIARKMRQREEDAEPTGLPSKRRRSVRGSPLHPGSIAGEDGGDGEADAMDAGASQASTDTSLLNEHTYRRLTYSERKQGSKSEMDTASKSEDSPFGGIKDYKWRQRRFHIVLFLHYNIKDINENHFAVIIGDRDQGKALYYNMMPFTEELFGNVKTRYARFLTAIGGPQVALSRGKGPEQTDSNSCGLLVWPTADHPATDASDLSANEEDPELPELGIIYGLPERRELKVEDRPMMALAACGTSFLPVQTLSKADIEALGPVRSASIPVATSKLVKEGPGGQVLTGEGLHSDAAMARSAENGLFSNTSFFIGAACDDPALSKDEMVVLVRKNCGIISYDSYKSDYSLSNRVTLLMLRLMPP
ncbi:hypothetical protein SLS63_009188 [Diaporthe eres]|uniref:Ulp1 protease family protein n=1 Tax=Diaporthe eres TaxID=83184 RepID=A0ABR1P0I6_DIAER